MFRITLAFAALFCLVACTDTDAAFAADIRTGEWAFSLANPVERAKYPGPIMRMASTPFTAGTRLSVITDSLILRKWLNNDRIALPLLPAPPESDSLEGYTLEPGVGSTLLVSHYVGDSLSDNWIFERAPASGKRLPFGALSGKSYHFNYPEEDALRVYFGTTTNMSFSRNRDQLAEYFSSTRPHQPHPRSVILPGTVHSSNYPHFDLELLRGNMLYFRFTDKNDGFGRNWHDLVRRRDSTIAAVWYEQQSGSYLRKEMTLVPAPPVAPSGADEQAFARFVNTGLLEIDNAYPRVDSADVSYSHEEYYYEQGGIEFSELEELEITFEPGGDFVVFVRNRPVRISKWRLTPDGGFVELIDEKGTPTQAYPIMAWTDDHIDLRMPFRVKTREPRGVELESYCMLDTFIRIKKGGSATSTQ